MAYGTRRKSLNLSLLGIHVPRASPRSPPTTTCGSSSSSSGGSSSSNSSSSTSCTTASTPITAQNSAISSPNARQNFSISPLAKRIKRSHSDAPALDSPADTDRSSVSSPTPEATVVSAVAAAATPSSSSSHQHHRSKSAIYRHHRQHSTHNRSPGYRHHHHHHHYHHNGAVAAAHTPPPSPPPSDGDDNIITLEESIKLDHRPIDVQTINDEVVVATIRLLEAAHNRPHMLKELATIISRHVQVVETSANQSAIISSRLTNFMKRPWTNAAPCPLGKDLIGTHPKRLYFYLAGRPHLAFPDPEPRLSTAIAAAAKAIALSPPILATHLLAPFDERDRVSSSSRRRRSEPSPSPELDLGVASMGFDNAIAVADTYTRSNSNASSVAAVQAAMSAVHSGGGPTLESDEHEFTQCAYALQMSRRNSEKYGKLDGLVRSDGLMAPPEYGLLLGDDADLSGRKPHLSMFSSPMLAQDRLIPLALDFSNMDCTAYGWGELKSPETVNLQELDRLLDS